MRFKGTILLARVHVSWPHAQHALCSAKTYNRASRGSALSLVPQYPSLLRQYVLTKAVQSAGYDANTILLNHPVPELPVLSPSTIIA